MATAPADPAPWSGVFAVDGVDGGPIRMEQLNRGRFLLRSHLEFSAAHPTGLDVPPAVDAAIRTLDPGPDGFATDLTSVPGPARWFVGRYGTHTPAALLHDVLIPATPVSPVSEVEADRYFRFMLQALDVRWLKRWVMWAAVAMRTRWASGGWKRITLVGWAFLSLVGMTALVIGLATGTTWLTITALIAPWLASALWWGQWGAGAIAAVAAPFMIPPALAAGLAWVVYAALEVLVGIVLGRDRRGSGPVKPEGI